MNFFDVNYFHSGWTQLAATFELLPPKRRTSGERLL
jgi:hypothetical protein